MKTQRKRWSWLARLACRLAKEQAGLAMMEYVVIAVLICAACFAIFRVLGKTIFNNTEAVVTTINGDPGTAAGTLNTKRGVITNETTGADTTGQQLRNAP